MTTKKLVLIIGVLAVAPAAYAGDPKFEYGKPEEAKKPEVSASAQAGLIITTGNSETTAISGGARASRRTGGNKVQAEVGGAYARSSIFLAADQNMDGFIQESEIQRPSTTTTKGWMVKTRYDRYLTTNNSLYVTAAAAADEPAGKELVGGGQAGYSRQLYKDAKHEVLGEAGYDFSYENPVVGDGVAIHSARLFAGYKGKLSADTGLEGAVEGLFNVNSLDTGSTTIDAFEDTRITTGIAVTTKLFENINFRFGFTAKYDHAPSPRAAFALPYAAGFVPLADALDTKTEATLIVNFL